MRIQESCHVFVPANCEGVAAIDGVGCPNKDGAEPNVEAGEEPKSGVCEGVVAAPNKEELGAAEDGVANREVAGAEEAGVLRNNPPPEEEFGVGKAADAGGAFELVINPATWVEVCVTVVVLAGR